MKIRIGFFSLCLLAITTHLQAQWAFSEMNLAHHYDPASEVSLYCQPSAKNDSLQLLVRFKINQEKPNLKHYNFDIFLPNSLNEKLNAPIQKNTIDSVMVSSFSGEHTMQFTMPDPQSAWAIIRVLSKKTGSTYYFEYPLNFYRNVDFTIQTDQQALLKSYTSADSFITDRNLTGFYYNHDFNNALPPMVTKSSMPDKALTVDSTFNLVADSAVVFSNEGLYFVQEDTSKHFGNSFRIENKYYPRHASLDQLIKPLVYITTKSEKQKLDNATEKKDFDQFWIDLTRSPDRARKIIREYYSRVEHANRYFTSFKEGWKTDQGMIYIIFGPPEEVVKSDNEEVWSYINHPRIPLTTFRFIKAENIFTPKYYVLIRDKAYDDIWFRAVDQWRKSRF